MRAILSKRLLQAFSGEQTKVSLPELNYSYSALEPVISGKLLETHHKKHHQTYVNNLNAALDQFEGTSVPTQKQRRTSTTTNWLASVRPSSSTLGGTSTTPSIGRTWPPSAKEEASIQGRIHPSRSRSSNSSAATTSSSKSSPREQSPSKVQAGAGSPTTTPPVPYASFSWPTNRCSPLQV